MIFPKSWPLNYFNAFSVAFALVFLSHILYGPYHGPLSLPITAVLSVSKFYPPQSNIYLLRFKVTPSIILTLTSFWLHQDFWSIDSNSFSLLFNNFMFSLLFLLNINSAIIYLITPLHSPISPLFYHTPLAKS